MDTIKCEVEIKATELPIVEELVNISSELFHIIYHLNSEGKVPKDAWDRATNLLNKFFDLGVHG